MKTLLKSLCVFMPTGKTFTFRNVQIVQDNEAALVFSYRAMSDGLAKTATFIKANIVGHSICTALLAILMLLPALAQAACYKMTMAQFQYDYPQTYTGSGFTVTYGTGWKNSIDADAGSQPGVRGMYANEPSASRSLYFSICDAFGTNGYPVCNFWDNVIDIDPPAKQIRFRYTGRFQIEHYEPSPPAYFINIATMPVTAYLYNEGYWYLGAVTGTDNPSESGHAYVTYPHGGSNGTLANEGGPCSGDPNGEFCNWNEILIQSNEPIYHLFIFGPDNGTLYSYDDARNGLWIDDLEVCTEIEQGCANPPCEMESAHRARTESNVIAGVPQPSFITQQPAPTAARRTSWGALKTIYR